MLPVIAIVGRPNVGKSTLFNCLTRSRNALVADEPGLTRDRRFGVSRAGERAFMAVDTGGLGEEADEMAHLVAEQAWRALAEADVALLVVDARTGLTPADELVAARLRSSHLPVVVAVNKAEGLDPALAEAEFHALGLGQPQAIAARHGYGIQALVQVLLARCPAPGPEEGTGRTGIRVAVVGRPNVGKSTLVNRILGHERVLTHDRPGTTRDSVYIPFERDGRHYTLIDTAGIRRRARVADRSEKFSVVQSLRAIEATEVAIVLMDAREGVTDQDAHLVGMVLDAGRAIVLALNKWDGLSPERRRHARQSVERKLEFAPFARVHFVSALHGTGVGDLFGSIDQAWQSASRDLSTPELSRVLEAAVERHAPPAVGGRRIKLRYAHQGGRNPPLVVIHGTRTALVPGAYRRYLERTFQRALGLEGTPVRVEFRTGANPYRGSTSRPSRTSRRTR